MASGVGRVIELQLAPRDPPSYLEPVVGLILDPPAWLYLAIAIVAIVLVVAIIYGVRNAKIDEDVAIEIMSNVLVLFLVLIATSLLIEHISAPWYLYPIGGSTIGIGSTWVILELAERSIEGSETVS